MSKAEFLEEGGAIEAIPLTRALSERYLSYALSTIMSRSLPDVRDGLKPVHRRLLFAMRQLKLDPNSPYKKSARVVGDVIGKFHPHGDQAIYDALVRLAQDFALRYPLIDGQGNFGNIDGDNAAAMRYTEARLTKVAEASAAGHRRGHGRLPPDLRRRGGRAGGAAGQLPQPPGQRRPGHRRRHGDLDPAPQRGRDLQRAALPHQDASGAGIEKLLEFMPGPDFPTGGILVEDRATLVSRPTARAAAPFRLRARWETEKVKGGGYQVVVTEVPFQVQKSRLVEKIAELLRPRSSPCWPTCATNPRRRCAWSWSPRVATWIPRC